MKIAVIGGGLFGCTAAVYAARAGHEVHLFERREALMQASSGCSYYRLHRGYHYPRSPETGREGRQAESLFMSEYGASVITGGRQFYLVPDSQDSHVTARQFVEFLDNEGLPFTELEPHPYRGTLFEVEEPRINLAALNALVEEKVAASGVIVHLGADVPFDAREQYDHIVVAAYASTNSVLGELGIPAQEYKFQVVEKPVVLMPPEFKDTSIVVVDGPFGCIDPIDDTPLHALGHVVHTVHSCNVGTAPEVPEALEAVIHRSLIRAPAVTNIRDVVTSLANYVPGVAWSQHIGSVYVLRAVLAHQEATDCRPTLVERLDDQVIRIFSGKLGTAVRAAQDAVAAISGRFQEAA